MNVLPLVVALTVPFGLAVSHQLKSLLSAFGVNCTSLTEIGRANAIPETMSAVVAAAALSRFFITKSPAVVDLGSL